MPLARSTGKAVFGDVIGGVIYAPVFWYSRGAYDAARYCLHLIVRQWKVLAVGVWMANIFVPMYGQRDLAGSLISFFMRLIQIIARSVGMVISLILIIALFVVYLVAPIFIIIELFRQLIGLFGA